MEKLKNLVSHINEQDAVNNKFYHVWMNQKLSLEDLAIFVRNYWEWTFRFPEALAGLISNTDDVIAQVEYVKTLYSEMGNGQIDKVHSTLFENFCKELAKNMGRPGFLDIQALRQTIPLLQETKDLNTWQKGTYSTNYAMAAGAQLALEWQAYTMIRKLYDGARNYMEFWQNPDGFHEACEFFYVHIGSAEKDHKDESIEAAAELITRGACFEDVELGFNKMLGLISNFWNGIANTLSHK